LARGHDRDSLEAMKRCLVRGLAVFGLLLFSVQGRSQGNVMTPAAGAPPAPHFVPAAAFNLGLILPAPPAPGSLAAQADLEVVLQVQAFRTPEQIAWAKTVEKQTAFTIYGELMGTWFVAEKLPLCVALVKEITEDVRPVSEAAKKIYPRARPYVVDPRVKPCVEAPANDTYPSGHALSSYLTAEVLAELVPERRAALFDQARRAAWGRIIGGVHFPTDIEGGRILAAAVIAELKKSPAFRASLEKCRAEFAAAALKRAA
jgi:acid phosphatase (class A)